MRKHLFGVAAVGMLLSSSCSPGTPCSGDNCLPVGGEYVFLINGGVDCPIWEKSVPPSSVLTLTQEGSALTATLWADTDDPHTFTGTLYSNHTINIQETEQNELLGIPYGTITGGFTSTSSVAGEPPFYFSGQLYLQGGGGGAANTTAPGVTGPTSSPQGSGLSCSGTTGLTAEEQAAGAPLPDAGSNPDAGTGPVADAG